LRKYGDVNTSADILTKASVLNAKKIKAVKLGLDKATEDR
jgi:hypothetical protein